MRSAVAFGAGPLTVHNVQAFESVLVIFAALPRNQLDCAREWGKQGCTTTSQVYIILVTYERCKWYGVHKRK
jgi:hypothetical protein